MFKGKMTEEELRIKYKSLGFEGLRDVCIEMGNRSKIPVDTDNVSVQLSRFGRLSRWQTIAFRNFFRQLEVEND